MVVASRYYRQEVTGVKRTYLAEYAGLSHQSEEAGNGDQGLDSDCPGKGRTVLAAASALAEMFWLLTQAQARTTKMEAASNPA